MRYLLFIVGVAFGYLLRPPPDPVPVIQRGAPISISQNCPRAPEESPCIINQQYVDSIKQYQNTLFDCYDRLTNARNEVVSLHEDVRKSGEEAEEWRVKYEGFRLEP